MKAVEARNLRKVFGEKDNAAVVLPDVSFSVENGQFVSIMGPSGCGKSTLLYLLGGLDEPTSGTVLIEGRDVNDMSDAKKSALRRERIGFVFQFYNLVQNLTVAENIMLPLRMSGVDTSSDEITERYEKMIEIVDLTGKENLIPRQLSGGQQQRVAIARAVIAKPAIVLADEPTGNLDSKNAEAVMRLFQQINDEQGITIVQVTHDESKARCGSRLIEMLDGAIENDAIL